MKDGESGVEKFTYAIVAKPPTAAGDQAIHAYSAVMVGGWWPTHGLGLWIMPVLSLSPNCFP